MNRRSLADVILTIEVQSRQPVEPELPFNGGYSEWSAELVATGAALQEDRVGVAMIVLCRDARWNPNFWDRLDEVSTDMEIIASALSANASQPDDALFGEDVFLGDVLIFDRIAIEPAWRGNQLSHVLVDAAARAIAPAALLALQPMPPREQNQLTIGRLQKHWEAAGFRPYRNGVYVKSSEPFEL
ncbi:MAG: hypothetical protein JWP57_4589 [Spirosoma sp.]|nr:hypothetical protein [Spirosoma sp.]